MNRIEQVLDTIRGENESWEQVFDRLNKNGKLDLKTLAKLIVCILEELDEKADRGSKKGTERGSLLFNSSTVSDLGTENNGFQERPASLETKI